MTTYKLKESVKLEMNESELTIIDMETGFVGTGNAHAHEILSELVNPATQHDVVESVKSHYVESQHSRIEKSVPNVLEWATQRGLLIVSED